MKTGSIAGKGCLWVGKGRHWWRRQEEVVFRTYFKDGNDSTGGWIGC